MNDVPVVVVGLWLLPVVVFFIIPLAILVVAVSMELASLMLAPSSIGKKVRTGKREKRIDRRIHADDLQVSVSDGIDMFSGLVCDISKLGICIMGIPEKMFSKAERLAVVVDGGSETFSLHVTPKWERDCQSGRQIGALIEYAPDGWGDFVRGKGAFSPVRA